MLLLAEEVIRRRLMIDGDGTGDDRRLNMFLKNLTKWAMSDDVSGADGYDTTPPPLQYIAAGGTEGGVCCRLFCSPVMSPACCGGRGD